MITESKMSKLIADHNLPLGSTETGRAWALKALHPSDPITTTRGIPDESCVPSVFMNYQSTHVIADLQNDEQPWNFDMTVTPHPISFACVEQYDGSVGATRSHPLLNPQLPGASHAEKFTAFRSLCDRWRLAYMSVTIQQDAPALADQGSIAACQTVYSPVKQNFSFSSGGYQWAARPFVASTIGDKPAFDKLQSMPGAYFTKSKEGLYMPIKLTRTHQNWRSDATNVFVSYSDVPIHQNGVGPLQTTQDANSVQCYPFPGIRGVSYNPVTSAFVGDVTSDMCNDVLGMISVQNVAPTTRFTVFVRAGYELQVLPGTTLTPQQMMSPEHDESALDAYFAISRKMKDGYPADYNDLGKIWDVIKSVARTVVPLMRGIPGIPGMVATGVDTALNFGEAVRSGFGKAEGELKRSRSKVASAVDIEDLRKKVSQAGANYFERSKPRLLRVVRAKPVQVPTGRRKSDRTADGLARIQGRKRS